MSEKKQYWMKLSDEKIAAGLRRKLSETEGFFDAEFDVDGFVVRVAGHIHREYNRSGDGFNEPIDYELDYENLQIEIVELLFDGFNALIDKDGINNIEKIILNGNFNKNTR